MASVIDNCTTPSGGKLVGLFGCYTAGNYGDDLMLFMFSRKLTEWGVRHIAYCGEEIGSQLDCQHTSDIDQFLGSIDMLLFGGGGLFIDKARCSKKFSGVLGHVANQCIENGITMYAFSVGGSGESEPQMDTERLQFLSGLEEVTLRNSEDRPFIEKFGISNKLYADVVWCLNDFFARRERAKQDSRTVIGIDSVLVGQGRRDIRILLKLIRMRRGRYQIVEVDQWIREEVDSSRIQYRELGTFVDRIQDVDIVISSRLHLNMTLLTLGKSAVLYDGAPKSQLFFERYGLNGLQFRGRWRKIWLWLEILTGRLPKRARRAVSALDLEGLAKDARQHFDELRDVLQKTDRL